VSSSATAPTLPAEEDQSLHDLCTVLDAAVRGGPGTGALDAQVERAFAAGSDWRPIGVADGLWAVVRTSADGTTRALCVHNLTTGPVTFTASAALRGSGLLHFVRGAARTSETAGGDIAFHVEGRSFVWLARIGTGPDGRS
jgi:hypothetical protein